VRACVHSPLFMRESAGLPDLISLQSRVKPATAKAAQHSGGSIPSLPWPIDRIDRFDSIRRMKNEADARGSKWAPERPSFPLATHSFIGCRQPISLLIVRTVGLIGLTTHCLQSTPVSTLVAGWPCGAAYYSTSTPVGMQSVPSTHLAASSAVSAPNVHVRALVLSSN